jgi:hypothetical protein
MKKSENDKIEITSVNVEKKLSAKEEEIDYCIKSMCKDREELNVVIMPSTKKLKDDKIIDFPKLIKNEEGKITMICDEERKEEVEAVFSDDPIITLPVDLKIEKKKDTEEEKYCHEDAMGDECNNSEMLDGNYSLKANLKRQEDKPVKSQFQEKREKIEEFFRKNVEAMLCNKKIIEEAEERRFTKRIEKANKKELRYELNLYNWNLV